MTNPIEGKRTDQDQYNARVEIANLGMNALLLINGGAAVALLALLQSTWHDNPSLAKAAFNGLIFFALGVLFGAATFQLRIMVSLAHQRQKPSYRWLNPLSYAVQIGALVMFVIGAVMVVATGARALPKVSAPQIEAYFSPRGGCTDAIVDEIGKAKSNVLVMAYSFTSDRIAGALADADRRGVDVRLIVDGGRDEERGGDLQTVTAAGVQAYIDRSHAIAHNKVMVIDSETVITGSFNFSAAAEERNAENLLVIRDRNLARRYEENWQKHVDHAEPYDGKATSP